MKVMIRSPYSDTDFFDSHWSLARRYTSTISIHLLRLHTMNINRSNERR